MSDSLPPAIAPTPSAGTLLRSARERLGLPLEELAAYLKVSPRRLEWIESDQFDKLLDGVFVRALARSMCRVLKIDPVPVLALLPKASSPQLNPVYSGADTAVRRVPLRLLRDDHWLATGPVIGGVAFLGAAVFLFFFLPSSWQTSTNVSPGVVSAASAPKAQVSAPQPAVAPVAEAASARAEGPLVASAPVAKPVPLAVPVPALGAARERPTLAPAAPNTPASAPGGTALAVPGAAKPAKPAGAAAARPAAAAPLPAASVPEATPQASVASVGLLQFRTSESAWVEVQDGQGSLLLSRKLDAGESVSVSGTTPLKVTLGNVKATQVAFRGRAVNLQSFTRGDVARFELN
jgi:cytoskeleton protein RodZ